MAVLSAQSVFWQLQEIMKDAIDKMCVSMQMTMKGEQLLEEGEQLLEEDEQLDEACEMEQGALQAKC
jgi:hypothetical protein